VIVDASLIIDTIADPGPREIAARDALAAQPAAERHATALHHRRRSDRTLRRIDHL